MRSYKSHKTVQAAKIMAMEVLRDDSAKLALDSGETQFVEPGWLAKHNPTGMFSDMIGGYFVEYSDGYQSFSPAEAFEQGYRLTVHNPEDGALPVKGYQPQSPEKVAIVNGFKADEERILRKLDDLRDDGTAQADPRWLAIGRTALEQAFMAINRSIFQPARAELPEDPVYEDTDGPYTA